MLFAVPLMLAPSAVLAPLGWPQVDPVAARLVAAALFGIGIASYLGRDAGPQAYRGMLNLKIIWSLAAILALSLGLIAGQHPVWPLAAALALFAGFNLVWVVWRLRLRA